MSRLLVCVLLVYLSSAQVPDIRYWNRNGLQWSDFRCQVPAQAKDTLAVSYVGIDYRMHAVEDSFYY